MSRTRMICLPLLLLFLVPAACEKLPEKPDAGQGDMDLIALPDMNKIPADWGDLVSVSNSSDFGHIFQLWFQDAERNIRVAFYNIRTNEFQPHARLIPRG